MTYTTFAPSVSPVSVSSTSSPTATPTPERTAATTSFPTKQPSALPTPLPTQTPSTSPSSPPPSARPTPAPTLAPTVTMSEAVPAGANQPFQFEVGGKEVMVSFANITGGGLLTVQTVAPGGENFLPLPSDFTLGSVPIYYEISTTAAFQGTLDVCLTYPADPSGVGSPPLMLHHNGTGWENVTTSVDPQTLTICGKLTSLSPVAVAYDASASGSAMSDPHLVAPNGARSISAVYTTLSVCLLTDSFDPHIHHPTIPRRGLRL